MTEDDKLAAFLAARPRLIRLAYRHLGRIGDAEDCVQEAWIKFAATNDIREPAAWLARVVTHAAIDRIRLVEKERAAYVGPWLPEPFVDPDADTDASDREIDISFAVMRTLETLTVPERAAFFLHDLFGLDFDMIGETIERSPAAARKLASRARKALAEGRRKTPARQADIDRVIAVLTEAYRTETLEPVLALFADDATLVSDGGGKAKAARNIIHGGLSVARFLLGVMGKNEGHAVTGEPLSANGQAMLAIRIDGVLGSLFSLDLDAEGRITTVYLVMNPDKLTRLS